MEKEENRRFMNNRLDMIHYLIKDISEKKQIHISIRKICSDLHISRTTFYSYYNSLDDLLDDTYCLLLKMKYDFLKKSIIDPDRGIKMMLTSLKKHPDHLIAYIALSFRFENQKEEKASLIEKEIDQTYSTIGIDKTTRLFYEYGISALIIRWLKNDCIIPIEEQKNEILRLYKNHN